MAGQGLKAVGPRPGPATTEEARAIRLDGREVSFVLRRSARRTFALQIDDRGVRVSVPCAAREAEIARFVAGHERWLLDKLAARAERREARSFDPIDGAILPVLGEGCRLRFEGSGGTSRWRTGVDGIEELVLGAPPDARETIVRALRKRALAWFSGRVAEYCSRLNCKVPPVRLSSARTRWGSCSACGGIRLHWRLIHLQRDLIDYVVAHEVAHLLEMNHSPRFWAVVASICPDWKLARSELRAASHCLPIIGANDCKHSPHND
jgi:predicted metal-dependent hydrolase